ncbi:MAG: gliding motility-associated-like protein [Parvicellaceae bacterium]|jgi:gliding motility-associated-like protein
MNLISKGILGAILVLAIAIPFNYTAQSTFRINYDIDNFDLPGGVVEAASGNYVFAGTNASFIPLYGDLTEIDINGNVVWSKSYIASIATSFNDIKRVSAGGYTVAGGSSPGLMLMNVDATGNFNWGNRYETNNGADDYASRFKQTSDGGYICAGQVSGYDVDGGGPAVPLDSNNIFIVKTNAAGTMSWHNIIVVTTAFDNDHFVNDVVEVSDGYIFVGETSEDQPTDNTDILLFKTDLSGNLVWIKKIDLGGTGEGLTSAKLMASGDVLVGGYFSSKALMMVVNSAGTVTWANGYDDPALLTTEVLVNTDAFVTSDGKYASLGTYIDPLGGPQIGTYLIKVEPATGGIIFQKFYTGGLSSLLPEGFQVSTDNGYMMVMMAQQMTGFNYHAIKTDQNGDLLDPACFAGTINVSNSGYTPSWTTVTPTTYTGATESAFIPVVSNVTPTEVVDCITCSLLDPTASAAPTTICEGSSSLISASGSGGGVTYEIYTVPSGGTSIGNAPFSVSPTSTTTYYIEATDGSCTSNRIPVIVTVNPQPSISVLPAAPTICTGDNVSLTASSGGPSPSYVWSPAGGLSGTTGATVTASPGATQIYTVTVTDANTCTNNTTVTVTVVPPPVALITGPTTVCDNQSITLTATPSGASSYLWSTGETTETIVISPGTSTLYDVTVTAGSCNDNDTHMVNVNTAPTAGISGTTTICAGDATTLTASPGSGVNYTWSTAESTGSISVSPVVNTTYQVLVSDGNGCVDSIQQLVSVNALPTVTGAGLPSTTVCNGDMVTLTGSGATSYVWTGGVSDGIPFPATSTATYTVTGTDANSCTNTDNVTITVNALPTVVANSATGTTACAGDMVTLTGSGASSYTWTGGVSDGIAFPIAGTNTYTVTGTDGNGCVNSDAITVTVNSLPSVTANASPGATVCSGDMVTLTGAGATSYSWTGGITDGVPFAATSTLTYTVTGTDGNSCTNTDNVTVTVNALPIVTANAAPSSTVCSGDMVTLSGSGASSYTWTGGISDGVPFAATITATYTVTGTDANSCVNTDAITITVNALPTITVTGLDTICDGDATTLTASGATSYSWDTGDNTPSTTVTPASTTTYIVTGTDANSCVNTAAVTVAVLPPPTAVITGPITACDNAPITLTASGGGTYSWSTGSTASSIVVNPTTDSTYAVTVSIGTCSDVATQTITVNTAPTGSVTGSNVVCLGDTATLTASGGTTYNWNTGGSSSSEVVSPSTATTYEAYVEDANGCIDTVQFLVNVNPLPNISISGNDSICIGDSTVLTAVGGIAYTWSTTEVTSSISVNPSTTSTYTVTGSDINTCSNTVSVIITVLPPPTASITGDTLVCQGSPILLVASGGGSYLWNTGATTTFITDSPVTTTSYSVVASVGTCSDTAQYTVNVTPTPAADAGSDVTIIIGQTVDLFASGGSTITWLADPTLSCTNCDDPTAAPTSSTTYCAEVIENGCVDTACVTVTVDIQCGDLFVPTAFSPNGDGSNDCFKVYSNCLKTLNLVVYARWGEVVYESSDVDACWDGTYKGEELNTSTFIYIVEVSLLDGTTESLKGNISLIR